jgi:hypothetical protein
MSLAVGAFGRDMISERGPNYTLSVIARLGSLPVLRNGTEDADLYGCNTAT